MPTYWFIRTGPLLTYLSVSVPSRQATWARSSPRSSPTVRPRKVGYNDIWCLVNKDYMKVLGIIDEIYIYNIDMYIISHNVYYIYTSKKIYTTYIT